MAAITVNVDVEGEDYNVHLRSDSFAEMRQILTMVSTAKFIYHLGQNAMIVDVAMAGIGKISVIMPGVDGRPEAVRILHEIVTLHRASLIADTALGEERELIRQQEESK